MVVPRIETQRLLLRELRMSDFEAYATHAADPDAQKFTSGAVDRRAAWRQLAAMTGQWLLTRAGWWGVELRATGEWVGTVGAFIRETTLQRKPPEIELGWSIARPYWRKGYASEAAIAVRDHALRAHDAAYLIAHIVKENTASIRVSERIGMRYEKDVDFYGEPCGRYVLDR